MALKQAYTKEDLVPVNMKHLLLPTIKCDRVWPILIEHSVLEQAPSGVYQMPIPIRLLPGCLGQQAILPLVCAALFTPWSSIGRLSCNTRWG